MATQSSSIRMLLIWCLISPPSLSRSPISTWLLSQRDGQPQEPRIITSSRTMRNLHRGFVPGNNVKVGGAAPLVSEVIKHTKSNNSTVGLCRPASISAEQEAKPCPATAKSQRHHDHLHTFCFFMLVASFVLQTNQQVWMLFLLKEEEEE